MDQTIPDLVPMIEAASEITQGIIANVGPDQWDMPSTCAGWSVRDVVDHLVTGNVMTTAAFVGDPETPETDLLGDDPAAAFTITSARLVEALQRPEALEREVAMPYGSMPGSTVAIFRFVDFLVHGWDIANPTGQPTDFAPELNETALAMSRQGMANYDRTENTMFGPEQPAPAGASAADRLAAYLGRTV